MNSLSPASHQARDIASLWWWMLGGAWLGFLLIACLLVFAWIRRNRRGIGRDTEGRTPGEAVSTWIVVTLGVALPIAVIATLFFVADVFVIRTTQAPAATKTAMTVQVIGRQWWWEVRYPGTGVVTANEIHIPTDTPVLLEATTADVIHSFWVPELNRKIDTIPGQVNEIELDAEKAGVYRGQCAEYCGVQHAHMALDVYAQPAAAYRTWLAHQKRHATPSTSPGARIFFSNSCTQCHTIRGTSASGTTGPDLTHLMSRATIAALTLPNTRANLAAWITRNQQIKPGNKMVDIAIGGRRLAELVAYLRTLR
ncbi:MAG: cytochrome c oxidase subunit II [Actinobacteria bacterium]|nr:cytochrome c oxidase subunit II [Actinomycetota bacterium]